MSKPKGYRAAEGKMFLLKTAQVMGNKKTNVFHSAFIGKGTASATSTYHAVDEKRNHQLPQGRQFALCLQKGSRDRKVISLHKEAT